MLTGIIAPVARRVWPCVRAIERRVVAWTRPANPGVLAGAVVDITRPKAELVAENALLRQQLAILRRQVKRPRCAPADRMWLVLLARCGRPWKDALLIVRPETLLRWHRAGFHLLWHARSRAASTRPRIPDDTIALIHAMATDNRLWGAERIRGELLKVGVRASKRTIQKYMRRARPPRRSGQSWATFLRNHAADIWACDFIQVTDLCFRSLFAFVIVEHASRRVVHVGVTRHPTDMWVAQQLREATPFGTGPRFLIRDNDAKYGAQFARVAAGSRIAVLRTPVRAPRANALCERFLGSVRRECLDHLIILHEAHLRRVLTAYVAYFNRARPHQGIGQRRPQPGIAADVAPCPGGGVVAVPVLGGLHHDYHRAA